MTKCFYTMTKLSFTNFTRSIPEYIVSKDPNKSILTLPKIQVCITYGFLTMSSKFPLRCMEDFNETLRIFKGGGL